MADRDRETGQFVLGHTGLGGRPKGARNRLGEQFLEALAQDFAEHGQRAIVACREERPTDYIKVVAGLLPKELLLRKDPVDEMSDAEIADALDLLRGMMARVGGNADQTTH